MCHELGAVLGERVGVTDCYRLTALTELFAVISDDGGVEPEGLGPASPAMYRSAEEPGIYRVIPAMSRLVEFDVKEVLVSGVRVWH
jgi:hypothetical protein